MNGHEKNQAVVCWCHQYSEIITQGSHMLIQCIDSSSLHNFSYSYERLQHEFL